MSAVSSRMQPGAVGCCAGLVAERRAGPLRGMIAVCCL